MAIYRPCYATREQVRRAVDVQQSAYSDQRIDRALMSASGSVEGLCQRKFYTRYTTFHWDWPNYQYAYPWRLWLDNRELAGAPTLFQTGSFLPNPITIPSSNYILKPEIGPPYTSIELRRDNNSAFGYNTTPQWDIAITGPFGYWTQKTPAGILAAALTDTTGNTVQISDASLVDVGDVLIIDAENMVVTNSGYVSTGISFTAGCTTASAADNTMTVPDGTKFDAQEVILVDSEWMLIQSIIGNKMIVKRAYSGSVLVTHNVGTSIYAKRLLYVLRGSVGTTAATHSLNAPMYIATIPDLVNDLTIAQASVNLIQGPAGYANNQQVSWRGQNQRGEGSQQENWPGPGLPDLREQVSEIYARRARTRVI